MRPALAARSTAPAERLGRLRDQRLRTAGVGLMLVALVGFLIGYSSAQSGPNTASLTSSIAKVASLEHPLSWRMATLPPAYAPLAGARRPFVLSRAGRAGRVVLVVTVFPSGGSPLPGGLLTRLSASPRAEVVRMISTQAYRYRGLTLNPLPLRATVYSIPIAAGQVLLAGCYAPAHASAVLRECEQIAEGLTLNQVDVPELEPNGHLAGMLRRTLPALLAQRLAIRHQMHAAGNQAQLALLATRMADAFADAGRALVALPAIAGSNAKAQLLAALASDQHDYAAYAALARAGRAGGYEEALAAIAEGESRLRAALQALALIGY